MSQNLLERTTAAEWCALVVSVLVIAGIVYAFARA